MVLQGANGIFRVAFAGEVRMCRIRGKRLVLDKREYNALCPGDEVRVMDQITIVERLPRRTVLSRFNRKRMAPQALAANVDLVVAMSSAARPAFRPRFLDRALVLSAAAGIRCLLVLTKVDLDVDTLEVDSKEQKDSGNRSETIRYVAYLESLGISTAVLSHTTGEGLDTFRERLHGRRAVLVGQSGVGKSTCIGILGGLNAKTGAVSGRTQKGRHTTTIGRLYPEIGIVDTPGIRELSVIGAGREAVETAFPAIAEQARFCAHDDCSHADEDGCAVRSYTPEPARSDDGAGAAADQLTPDLLRLFWVRRLASYQTLRSEVGVEP